MIILCVLIIIERCKKNLRGIVTYTILTEKS